MRKLMPLIALLTFGFTLYMNYLASTGILNGTTVGDISEKYPTLITPASYAFSIWGLIYIGLTAFVVYQLRPLWSSSREVIGVHYIRLLFIGTNVLNGIWILVWVSDEIGLSLLIMILLFLHLWVILMNIHKHAQPKSYHWAVDVPFQIYAGWITTALIANAAVYLTKLDANVLDILSETGWTLLILGVATLIYLLVMKWRKLPYFGLTGCWAISAIAVRQWELNSSVGTAAVIASGILLIFSIRTFLR